MNQIPNIEEIEALSEKIHHLYCAQYEKDNGEPYWTKGDYSKLDERTKEYDRNIARFIHQQLQKARQDWLREEIVRLEGILVPPYPHEGAHGDAISLAAQRGYQDALQTIIDRYHSELDQDKK